MKNTVKKIMSLLLVLAIIASLTVPALAGEAVNSNLANGTYSIGGEGYSTAMIAPDETDFPSYVVVKDGAAWLITRSYAPNKFDAVWKGKRSDAPADASTANVIAGVFIEDENGVYKNSGAQYSGNSHEGYKAVQFVIPLTSEELSAGDVYFVLRRASWSASNPGAWMGSADQHFDFGTLTKKSDSTEVPGLEANPEGSTFGFTLQVGKYVEGTDFHTASFEGVTYKLQDNLGNEIQPSNSTSGMLTYSSLDSSKTYTFTASKEGWAVVRQGEWNAAAHAYDYIFTGADTISITITSADDGKNITDSVRPGLIFRIVPVKTVLDLALECVPGNLAIFTSESTAPLITAVNAANTAETDETKLQNMADAINEALSRLVPLDGSYDASFAHTGNGMFKIIDVKSLDVENGKMTLHFVNGSKTYTKLFIGTTDEANLASDTDLIFPGEETTASNGKAGYNWSVPISALDTEIKLAAYSSKKTTFNSTGDFLIPAKSLVKKNGTDESSSIPLAITNNTGMFKAVSALLNTSDGRTEIVFALSGNGYREFFKGTYEEAAANGADTSKWIHGTTNSDGKWEFRVPVEDGESLIPLVAISKSYYDKYVNGENPIERAFYPRQIEINRSAKTLVTGDYSSSTYLDITNNVKMFSVDSALISTVGGPNSNNYKALLLLSMGSTSFDKAFVGTAAAAAAANETIAISDSNCFEIPVKWVETVGQPETLHNLLGDAFVVSFHSVSKDVWYERTFAVNEVAATLVITSNGSSGGSDPNPGGSGSGGSSETPADSSVELAITNNTGMFKAVTASLETSGGSEYIVAALSGSTYHELFKGTYEEAVRNGDNRANWIHGYENNDGKWEFRIPIAANETVVPVVSVSSTYLEKYENGENPIERSFYPRQFIINRSAKTLEVGDYDQTVTMTLSSNVSGFGVRSSASVHVVGGPNSNNYKVETTLSMTDDKFDQITYPTVKDGKISTDTAALSNNTFTISLTNAPQLTAFKDGESFDITLREKESGKNVSAYMTINLLEKTIKITATSISGSGGGSAESKKDEENKDDAAKTDTPAVSETVKVEAKADANGVAAAKVEAKTVTDAVKSAAEKKADSIVIKPEVTGDAKEVKVELPKESVSEIAKSTDAALVIETDKGSVEVPNEVLAEIAKQADGASVEITVAVKSVEDATVKEAISDKIGDDVATDNAAVAEITVTSGDKKITTFSGKMINASVSVDGKKGFDAGKKYLALVISENGKRELLAGKCAKGADGKLNVGIKVGHLSTFVVLDKELKSFADAEAHWSADAVDFAVANGLMNGTSDTSFAPNSNLNRAMLVTILYRLAGSPAAKADNKFADVAAGQWYSDAVAWAAANGIVTGKTETTFAPMENITREQFATMLMRYCKFAGIDTAKNADLGAFTDSASISSYAKDALAWANASGIITGRTATTIAPTGSATRGEAATMLMRFMQM